MEYLPQKNKPELVRDKYYLANEIDKYNIQDLREGDTIYFEMPPMCSGEYKISVSRDSNGFYTRDKPYFDGCYDFRINKPYWS